MTLKETIDDFKKQFLTQATPEAIAVMTRTTGEVQASVASRPIPTVGTALPAFALPDSGGNEVSLASLLESGPLVVSFFRGMW